jgi:hypothetical protein
MVFKMKNNQYILTIIMAFFFALSGKSQNVWISMDSTLVNPPILIYGKIPNISAIKGVHIILQDTLQKTEVLNDTLFFISSQVGGGSKLMYREEKTAFMGIRFEREIQLEQEIKGVYRFYTSLLYQNGQVGEKKMTYLRNK